MVDFNAVINGKKEVSEEEKPEIMDEVREDIALNTAPYDLTPIKKRFEAIKEQIDLMVIASAGHAVKDAESEKTGIEMMGQAKKLWKKIDDQRKGWKKPHNEFNKSVENLCQVYLKPLLEIEFHQKAIGSAYQTRLILAQREAEKKAQVAAAKVQKNVDKEAKAMGVESVQIPLPVAREPEKTKRTEEGSVTYISKWVPTIVNPDLVPDEYVVRQVNMKKVKEAIAGGVREIPGLDITEIKEARLRT